MKSAGIVICTFINVFFLAFSEQYQDHETGSLMLDLHIEGAAPVTLLGQVHHMFPRSLFTMAIRVVKFSSVSTKM